MATWKNHYHYLEAHLFPFFGALGIDTDFVKGIIGAHGDKCRQYQHKWDENKIPFHQGAAIYLLSYIAPFSKEVREQPDGTFVAPGDWVVKSYPKYAQALEQIEKARTEKVATVHLAKLLGEKVPVDIIEPLSGEVLIPKNKVITLTMLKNMVPGLASAQPEDPHPIGRVIREMAAAAKNDPDPLGNVIIFVGSPHQSTETDRKQMMGRAKRKPSDPEIQ